MTSLQLQACLAAAVTLALYAFYCYWEAGRADLAANFRHVAAAPRHVLQHGQAGAGYRSRARWAGMAAAALVVGCLVAAV